MVVILLIIILLNFNDSNLHNNKSCLNTQTQNTNNTTQHHLSGGISLTKDFTAESKNLTRQISILSSAVVHKTYGPGWAYVKPSKGSLSNRKQLLLKDGKSE